MGAAAGPANRGVRFEPGERPPLPAVLGLGLQIAGTPLFVAILVPTVAFPAAGAADRLVTGGVFVSVQVCGLTAALQAARFGRIGAGFILAPSVSAAAIAVAADALRSGGPALLATLVVSAAVLQLLLSLRLSWLRRILTPTVSATVVLLIVVNVMPVIYGMLDDVPEGVSPTAAPLAALTTVFVIAAISLKATGVWRLWAPIAGVVAGAAVAAPFGLYDTTRLAEAAWIAVPEPQWPGLDLTLGSTYWALLPAFGFVTLVTTMQAISGVLASQNVSWRRRRAVDYRSVQNAVATSGVSSVLAGLSGGISMSSLSTGASVIQITGVASRAVGFAMGAVLAAFAFMPKALNLILSVPGAVLGAYIAVLMAILFAVGLKLLLTDGFDHRKGLIVGLSFWIGLGFQYDLIFPELIRDFAGGLLTNGMTSGGLVAILLTGFMLLTEPRASRLRTDLDRSAGEDLQQFLAGFAARSGFGEPMAERLAAVGDEALLTLLSPEGATDRPGSRRLGVTARRRGAGATLEFVASTGSENVEDRMALLGDRVDEVSAEREVSLRLLRHLSSSVRHQQYHDTDVVTVQVDAPEAAD